MIPATQRRLTLCLANSTLDASGFLQVQSLQATHTGATGLPCWTDRLDFVAHAAGSLSCFFAPVLSTGAAQYGGAWREIRMDGNRPE